MAGWIEISLLAALVVGFATGVLNHARIIRILRRRHEDEWKQIGSPSLIENNSIANARRLRVFLKNRGHERLGDEQLNRSVRVQQFIERAYVVVLLVFAIYFIASLSVK